MFHVYVIVSEGFTERFRISAPEAPHAKTSGASGIRMSEKFQLPKVEDFEPLIGPAAVGRILQKAAALRGCA
jgi:hypothetical protein